MVTFKHVNHRSFHDLIRCAEIFLAPMAYPPIWNKPISCDILAAFPWAYKVFLNCVREEILKKNTKHDLTKILGHYAISVPTCEEYSPPKVIFLYVAYVPDCSRNSKNEAQVKVVTQAVNYALEHRFPSLCIPSFVYIANTIEHRRSIAEETISAILNTVPPEADLKVVFPSYVELPVQAVN